MSLLDKISGVHPLNRVLIKEGWNEELRSKVLEAVLSYDVMLSTIKRIYIVAKSNQRIRKKWLITECQNVLLSKSDNETL